MRGLAFRRHQMQRVLMNEAVYLPRVSFGCRFTFLRLWVPNC